MSACNAGGPKLAPSAHIQRVRQLVATPHWRRLRAGYDGSTSCTRTTPRPLTAMVSPLKARRSSMHNTGIRPVPFVSQLKGPSIHTSMVLFQRSYHSSPRFNIQATACHTGNAQAHAVRQFAAHPRPASRLCKSNMQGRSCCITEVALGSWITQVNSPVSQGALAVRRRHAPAPAIRRAYAPNSFKVPATTVNAPDS